MSQKKDQRYLRKTRKKVKRLSLGSWLFVDGKQIKTHFVGKLIVKPPFLVEHLVHCYPLLQLVLVVESPDLLFVKPVILSPVWSCLEFFKEFVFHHLLKLFSSESSGEEWYLKRAHSKSFIKPREASFFSRLFEGVEGLERCLSLIV